MREVVLDFDMLSYPYCSYISRCFTTEVVLVSNEFHLSVDQSVHGLTFFVLDCVTFFDMALLLWHVSLCFTDISDLSFPH